MASAAVKKLSQELVAIASDTRQLDTAAGKATLTSALRSQHAQLIVQASQLIAAHKPSGFEAALHAAYTALSTERASTLDPGALAKAAILVALDAVEYGDAELFVEAAQYVQLERAKGGTREMGAALRARGVLGLARVGHTDILPILGASLADHDGTVRLSAARAVAHRRQRDGAGLLLLRLGAGDESPEVLHECIRGLFAIAPDLALRRARAALDTDDQPQREQWLHALGTAPHDDAIELLARELASQPLAEERQAIIQALGLSLRARARDVLFELLQNDRTSDAEAAISALAIHRYDAKLKARVEELTAHSPALSERVRRSFSGK